MKSLFIFRWFKFFLYIISLLISLFLSYFNFLFLSSIHIGNSYNQWSIDIMNPWSLPWSLPWLNRMILFYINDNKKEKIKVNIRYIWYNDMRHEYKLNSFIFIHSILSNIFYLLTDFYGFDLFIGLLSIKLISYK